MYLTDKSSGCKYFHIDMISSEVLNCTILPSKTAEEAIICTSKCNRRISYNKS